MNKISAESGFQLLYRFNEKPSLSDLDNILFPNGLKGGDIVQLTGESAVGKSTLLLKYLTKSLLPKYYNGVFLGGLNVGVILIDTSHGISILKLACLMEKFISQICECLTKSGSLKMIHFIY